jgi:leader peptidase (prepilin peptidase)/N-methyltransferase
MSISIFELLAAAGFGLAAFAAAVPAIRRFGRKNCLREVLFTALGGVLGAAFGLFWAMPAALTLTAFAAVLGAVAVVDADTQEIPDVFELLLLIAAAVSCFTMPELPLLARAVGAVCVSVPMLLLDFWKEGAFGGGDIKLMACCGLFLGGKLTLMAAFFAVLGGGAYGAWLLAKRRAQRTDHFAFGPFLCAGMLAAVFWGDAVLQWYIGLCGFSNF